jgi:hypothetical protein
MSKQELKQLCEDTLAAIEAHERGGSVQCFHSHDERWHDIRTPDWIEAPAYRPKPVPRVVYIDFDADEERWHSEAEFAAASNPGRFTKFIEVIE